MGAKLKLFARLAVFALVCISGLAEAQGYAARARTVSGGGSGVYVMTCSAVGCRLSLGSSARYMIDDGTYWTLNTGLSITGTGSTVNLYDSGETSFQVTRTGSVGTSASPKYQFGRIISTVDSAGNTTDNLRLLASDNSDAEHAIMAWERATGTAAVINNLFRGAQLEAYYHDHAANPDWRFNAGHTRPYPFSGTQTALELGPGAKKIAIGGCTRVATTVTCTTDIAHNFVAGDTVNIQSLDGSDDPAFASGAKTLVTAGAGTSTFTYTEAGTATSSVEVLTASSPPDVSIGRYWTGAIRYLVIGGATGLVISNFTVDGNGMVVPGGAVYAPSTSTVALKGGNSKTSGIFNAADTAATASATTDRIFEIRNNGTAKAGFKYDGGLKFVGVATGSLMACNAEQAGTIQYDTTTLKHVGCDGTTWNNLY